MSDRISFSIDKTVEILERTPGVVRALLAGLSEEWIHHNEGGESWSPFVVVGHLLHGEKTDWLGRISLILSDAEDRTFAPFDRFAQLETSKGKTIDALLDEFEQLRMANLARLRALGIRPEDLDRTGNHPLLGTVTLRQVISTWAVHDLNHLSQIERVLATQYRDEIGPWAEFLRIVKR